MKGADYSSREEARRFVHALYHGCSVGSPIPAERRSMSIASEWPEVALPPDVDLSCRPSARKVDGGDRTHSQQSGLCGCASTNPGGKAVRLGRSFANPSSANARINPRRSMVAGNAYVACVAHDVTMRVRAAGPLF